MAKTLLITAASGTVGTHLVDRLLAAGHSVKAASRTVKHGASGHVKFDFADPSTFEEAIATVDAAYIVVPTGTTDLGPVAAFIDLAATKGVKVVLQTAIGVDASDDIPYRQLELRVENSGARYVLLRPNWFFDNFHTFWLQGIRTHDLIALPAGDARTTFIDARDIADAASAALVGNQFDGQAITLTGADSLSYQEAADVISRLRNRTVRYEAVDTEGFTAYAQKTGLSATHAQFLAPVFYPVAQGWVGADNGEVARMTGKPPRRFVDYFSDYAARFR
ncbi:NmrA family protein (plasmid) [Rhizobium leguminosarum bv. trifolii WSM2304]|uniref:NmrA family protein n=1 Tax=Rhizobium leguminosarum bv. trifolii (strain WSM2304) TaxID=395492 RepID=A0ABF7QZE2_RHILW|nr:NAD(P)H-binding protein [Rhizobium leguminosarum]ACI59714.1 NmrA family protein [Rhizobium leguminosarum bv. trifolii WSM2304]